MTTLFDSFRTHFMESQRRFITLILASRPLHSEVETFVVVTFVWKQPYYVTSDHVVLNMQHDDVK